MRPRSNLNVYERCIIEVMSKFYEPMTIHEIAYQTGIHWKTAENHLKKLKTKELVIKMKEGARVRWQAIRMK